MATPDETRADIAAAREEFRAALAGAADGWDERPEGDEWTRREIAEHAIAVDFRFADRAARIAGGERVERDDPALATAAEALAAFAGSSAHSDAAWGRLGEEQLREELRPDMTAARLMELVGSHLREHASQIAAS